MISSKQLAEAIYKISNDASLKDEDTSVAVLNYIDTYNLQSLLPKVIRHLEDRKNKDLAWETLDIESGLSINDTIVDSIKMKLKANDAKVVKSGVNGELVGGFKATYKGVIYDASMKNQLQLLRNALTK